MIAFLESPELNHSVLWFCETTVSKFGVNQEVGWCLLSMGEISPLNSGKNIMALMPSLEFERSEFYGCLAKVRLKAPNYSNIISAFPEEALLRFALTENASDYWVSLALRWLDENKEAQITLHSEMLRLEGNKVISQKNRQHLKKLTSSLARKRG